MPAMRHTHLQGKTVREEHPLVPHMSGLTPKWKITQKVTVRRADHTEFRNESCDEMSGGDVESGIPSFYPRSSQRLPPQCGDLLRVALFDGDCISINSRQINTAARCTDIEGNSMCPSHQSKVVGAHFVGHITVSCNAVTAHQNRIHLTTTHQ